MSPSAPSAVSSAMAAAASDHPCPYSSADFRAELARSRRARKRRIVLAVVIVIVVVALAAAAVAVLTSHKVADASMEPVLSEGQAVLVIPADTFESGMVVAYAASETSDEVRFGRVVALSGNWVSIASDGTVAVSEVQLTAETAKSVFGANASTATSLQVPEGSYYVLGDAESATLTGLQTGEDFIAGSRIAGRALLSVWPLASFGLVA